MRYQWILFLFFFTISCYKTTSSIKPLIVTINPLRAILSEIVGTRHTLITLLPPGATPHGFELKPSQVALIQNSLSVIYISNHMDGWAINSEIKNKLRLIDLIPENEKIMIEDEENPQIREVDPHFWLEPLLVSSLIPKITNHLCQVDPEGCQGFQINADHFMRVLGNLDTTISQKISQTNRLPVFTTHSFLNYYAKRYGIKIMGSFYHSPGKEPTAHDFKVLIDQLKKEKSGGLLAEIQFPRSTLMALSEATQIPIIVTDPIGGTNELFTYEQLLTHNTEQITKVLQ